MIKIKKIVGILILLFTTFFISCASMGIEKAKYSIIEQDHKFEIRQYEAQIIAETIVDSDFDSAGNMAFNRLYGYISGNNRKKESIKMTAPVNQKADSEKISMTAPVNQQKSENKWAISFLMPSKYTIETIPEPTDPNVKIREIPPHKIAAVRYSGTWSQKRYLEHKAKLEQFIMDNEYKIIGEAIFARYDPPFQLWFLRRNEVLIPVE